MRTSNIGTKVGVVLATGMLLATSACGGGSRPSTAELQKAIEKGNTALGSDFKVPKSISKCVAKAFHDSDISNGALNKLVDGKKDAKISSKDQSAAKKIAPDVQKCASKATQ